MHGTMVRYQMFARACEHCLARRVAMETANKVGGAASAMF